MRSHVGSAAIEVSDTAPMPLIKNMFFRKRQYLIILIFVERGVVNRWVVFY